MVLPTENTYYPHLADEFSFLYYSPVNPAYSIILMIKISLLRNTYN
jgi:hypothetical protein